MKTENRHQSKLSPAVSVILLFGVISMFGDVIYETARSSNSQYLQMLGISAAKVGFVFGLGEFLGYFLRILSGILSDKHGNHWIFLFLGYGLLLVVPLIGLTTQWNFIIVFILLERIGKALRSPAKDTILSGVADQQVGVGFAFGLQEALDQIGAFAGPLIFTALFYFTGRNGIAEYQMGYRALIIPYIALMLLLYLVSRRVKSRQLLPAHQAKPVEEQTNPIFWMYMAFTFFCTMGFVNFSTVGYHLKTAGLMSDGNIVLLYSMAMAVDAVAALVVGRAYDKCKKSSGEKSGGLLILVILPILSLLQPFFSLSHSVPLLCIGLVLFGIIMGMHETVMRSAIADVTPFHKRGIAYGIFNAAYGLALFIGASLMGFLYDLQQLPLLYLFTILSEILSLILYVKLRTLVKQSAQ